MPSDTLPERLAQAQFNRVRRRNRFFGFGAMAFGAVLLVGAAIHLLQRIPLPDRADTASQTPQVEETQSPQPDTGTSESPPDEYAETDAQIDQTDQTFRTQFMQHLAQYESEIEPRIEAIHLPNWAGDQAAELERLKARAVEHFALGEYLLARQTLQQADELATAALAEHPARLAAAKREAKEAFANQQSAQADEALQRALSLSPNDAEMRALEKRIAVLPRVLDLLRQAAVAQNENRPEKEIAALQESLALDPSRTEVAARLAALRAERTQRQFADALRRANDALDAGDLAEAEKRIDAAAALVPASQSLDPLRERLKQARIDVEFDNQTALGESAVRADNWATAARYFHLAQQLKPNDKTAVENHDSARKVVAIGEKIRRMLAQEERLADRDVVDSVAAYLRQVEPVVGVSAGLREIHGELARKVALYLIEVDVVVVSDNATHIVVRGEGRVGKTTRRTIRLRPGRHIFEGSRPGYKSKLVRVEIEPGGAPVEVTVICDERI